MEEEILDDGHSNPGKIPGLSGKFRANMLKYFNNLNVNNVTNVFFNFGILN